MSERLLIAKEVAELLSVPESWVREATRDGRLPYLALGRYRRYSREAIEAWLKEQRGGPAKRLPMNRLRGVIGSLALAPEGFPVGFCTGLLFARERRVEATGDVPAKDATQTRSLAFAVGRAAALSPPGVMESGEQGQALDRSGGHRLAFRAELSLS